MRFSRVIATIDRRALAKSHQVFRLHSSKDKLGYADEVFDGLTASAVVVAVSFLGNGEAWVMTRRLRGVTGVFRDVLSGRDDMSFHEHKSLADVSDRVLLQLCLCAIAGDDGMDGASNVCGRLIVVSLAHSELAKGTIRALDVGVSPRMELELRVRTFTSCGVRHFKRSMPRFELVDGRYLRRVTSFRDPDDKALFCQRAKSKNDRYGDFAFMDASGVHEFAKSKLGILRSMLECLDDMFDGAISVDFEEAEVTSQVSRTAVKAMPRMLCVINRIGDMPICVSDATGEHVDDAKTVVETIKKIAKAVEKEQRAGDLGLRVETSDCIMDGAANIRIVEAKKTYVDESGDPYDAHSGFVVQHMTPRLASNSSAVSVVLKELAIKVDIAVGRMSLIPWRWGDWEFGVTIPGENGDSFAFLQVDADGVMHFEGPVSATSAVVWHGELVNALLLHAGCECVVRGPDGDVNVISKTELFGVPDFDVVWHDLVNVPESRKWKDGRPMKHAISKARGEAGIGRYFSDAVDMASCTSADGKRYYRVGLWGPGMQFSATHKASILREVIAMDGSRSLVDDVLPMLDVDMVRWGQTTVLPYPVKYLREWILANGE